MIKHAKYNINGKVVVSWGLFFLLLVTTSTILAQANIILGAEQLELYTPSLENKKIALVVNHTSLIGHTHLVDTLISKNLSIKKVFAPEHGFRGNADAGAAIASDTDIKTGLPIISLYGKNKKPTKDQLKDIDVVIFDIQDVGTRFYTYISTMHLVMEACAENDIPFIVLDRPNPNGEYIDGPLLDMQNQSFVGMHPIPILHGLTVGELAQMINGEKWLNNELRCDLTVIPMKNYQHDLPYTLKVKPSPNLPNNLSIKLYPSLCLFEGTAISVGRGTDAPFQQIGHPILKDKYSYFFTPKSTSGAKYPLYENQKCYGLLFSDGETEGGFQLKYLIEMYQEMPKNIDFFNNFFIKLAGTDELEKQIKAGFTAEAIRLSWQTDLKKYMEMRNKYVIYQ